MIVAFFFSFFFCFVVVVVVVVFFLFFFLGGGCFFVTLIIFLTRLKRNAVEIIKDDAFARKECSTALRTFLRVSAGVNKPLSVVESYCFSRMNISL